MKIKDKDGNILGSTILAADDDTGFEGVDFDDGMDDGASDTLDDVVDTIEDIQDEVEDIQQDDPNIERENNIENHYIAECDRCHGIFISAVIESDQEVNRISGICPLCEKESDQYLYWIIRAVDTEDDVQDMQMPNM